MFGTAPVVVATLAAVVRGLGSAITLVVTVRGDGERVDAFCCKIGISVAGLRLFLDRWRGSSGEESKIEERIGPLDSHLYRVCSLAGSSWGLGEGEELWLPSRSCAFLAARKDSLWDLFEFGGLGDGDCVLRFIFHKANSSCLCSDTAYSYCDRTMIFWNNH